MPAPPPSDPPTREPDPEPGRERLRVPPDRAGDRLDRVLTDLCGDLPRARVRELIEDGRVRVGDQAARKPARPVAAGEWIEVERVLRDRTRPGGRGAPELAVVHEDADLIVVDKPAGQVVHPSEVVRGGTVAELAAERYGDLPELQSGPHRAGVVHRLDADTSGLLLLARTAAAGEELLRQFRAREVRKTYLALVHGAPRFDSDWIEAAIGRHPRQPEKMSIVPDGEGRAAETFYETRERFRGFALLAAKPVTGRTHQIRVHLASIGHPVVGDRLYRRRDTPRLPKDAPSMPRQALHAHALELAHPITGEPVRFESPLPADMERFLTWLRAERALQEGSS